MADIANEHRTSRESLEESVQRISDAGHEVALTAVGLVALGVEGTQRLWQQREIVLEKAQKRGVLIEEEAIAFAKRAEERVSAQVKNARSQRKDAVSPRQAVHKFAYKLKERVESKLAKYNAEPTTVEHQTIEITVIDDGTESAQKSAIEAEGVALQSTPVSTELPLPNYDELRAKAILAAIVDYSDAELKQIYAYEEQNKQRKTVLQALERRITTEGK